jgi:DNA invertase Pin-like site-specific DNA recombinase
MKAVIFARVSSKDQEDGHSLDAQIQSCFEYAIKNDLKVIEQFRVVESSTATGRPEFSKMVNLVKKQSDKIIVLCYCVDRLQRDFDEQYIELQKLIKVGKLEIHFVKNEFIEHKDMDSSAKFRKNLDVLLANDYRNKISDNVKRSSSKKLAEGTICGDSPLGYLNRPRVDKKKEKVEVYIDPDRGNLVKRMFEMYSTGLYSMEDLRIFAEQEGLRSKKNCKISKSQIEKILKNPFYYGYMRYNGILYKHIHPKLISKELFDSCQDVKLGRKKTKSRRTQKPFTLKGLLKCHHCGCAYSPEIKKGKYVYMRPTKSQGECSECFHLNENKILSQIEEALKGIQIPQHILLEIGEELKKSSNKEHNHQIQESNKLQKQYELIQTRIKKVREFYIDQEFSKEEYNESMTDLQVERQNIETRLQRLSNADDSFNQNVSTIFELASKAYELFKSSDVEEKRRILVLLFPNLQMNGGKLMLEPRKPFDVFFNQAHRQEWLPILHILRTNHYQDVTEFGIRIADQYHKLKRV